MKHIFFTVTNDLNFDQRMHRICSSLASNGYKVTLVGRKRQKSLPLQQQNFYQHRIQCFFEKGFLFYAEYNLRLFLFLFFQKMDAICAIDLDSILPCLLVSKIKSIPRFYDAHEYFTEMKEVHTRPLVKKIWLSIERFCVPKFKYGYTVSNGIAQLLKEKYKRNYLLIRNIPVLKEIRTQPATTKFILYQGAVNEARGFEHLIPAMQKIDYPLIICGDGNFMDQLKVLIDYYDVKEKVELRGMLSPDELWKISPAATLGINLLEEGGMHQYYSLANKFFDYMHAGVPQLTMNYPEYQAINNQCKVAVLIDNLDSDIIANTINSVMADEKLLNELRNNCLIAREIFTWQQEEKKLISLYNMVFSKS